MNKEDPYMYHIRSKERKDLLSFINHFEKVESISKSVEKLKEQIKNLDIFIENYEKSMVNDID